MIGREKGRDQTVGESFIDVNRPCDGDIQYLVLVGCRLVFLPVGAESRVRRDGGRLEYPRLPPARLQSRRRDRVLGFDGMASRAGAQGPIRLLRRFADPPAVRKFQVCKIDDDDDDFSI